MVLCVRHGLDYDIAVQLPELELNAFFYQILIQDGYEIDWKTGSWSEKKKSTPK